MKRIDQLKQQREELDKRIRELAAQDQRAERKRDDRRKMIIGGWVIKHRPDLVKNIIESGLEREQDKAAFEGWTGLPVVDVKPLDAKPKDDKPKEEKP